MRECIDSISWQIQCLCVTTTKRRISAVVTQQSYYNHVCFTMNSTISKCLYQCGNILFFHIPRFVNWTKLEGKVPTSVLLVKLMKPVGSGGNKRWEVTDGIESDMSFIVVSHPRLSVLYSWVHQTMNSLKLLWSIANSAGNKPFRLLLGRLNDSISVLSMLHRSLSEFIVWCTHE